jgi:hypothetical protein
MIEYKNTEFITNQGNFIFSYRSLICLDHDGKNTTSLYCQAVMHKACEYVCVSEANRVNVLATAPTITLFVDPPGLPDYSSFHSECRDRLLAQCPPHNSIQHKNSLPAVFMLTHLGSNQDSAEPKSDVLPITPWVNSAAKLKKKLIVFIRFNI